MDNSYREPVLSVVMATFNGERFIEEQLHSILDQTLTPVEIIITDDRSADATVNIIRGLKEKNDVLKIFSNEVQLGVVENFKKAVSFTNSENFIAFADQDDIWLPQKLEVNMTALKKINEPELPCMVYSDLIMIDQYDNIIDSSFWSAIGINTYIHCFETALFGNPVTGCSMVINQDLRKYCLSMPSDVVMHDAWLALCAFTFGKVYPLKEPLLKYRQHGNNVSKLSSFKKKNRLERIGEELLAALMSNDNLFKDQFEIVDHFYEVFHSDMERHKRIAFEQFLTLRRQSYIAKKIAFRKVLSKYKSD